MTVAVKLVLSGVIAGQPAGSGGGGSGGGGGGSGGGSTTGLSIPITFYNLNSSASAVAPGVSYGSPFKDSDVPAGGSVTAIDSNGNDVVVQMDGGPSGGSTWPSGCLKYPTLSHRCAETFAPSGSKAYTLRPSTSPPNNTVDASAWGGSAAINWAATLAANSDFKVVYSGGDLGSNVYTVSLNTIFSLTGPRNPGWGTSYPTSGWEMTKQGPVCLEFHGWQYLKNDSTGKYHGYIRSDIWVKAWGPSGPFEIDVRTCAPNIWNTITQSSATSERYNQQQGRVACNVQVKNGSTVLRYQGGANDPSSVTVANAKFLTATNRIDYPNGDFLNQTGIKLSSTGTLPTGLNSTDIYWPLYQPAAGNYYLGAQRYFVSAMEQTFSFPSAWQANHAYVVGDWVSQNNVAYYCTQAGTSAGSGGPTTGTQGVNSDITDGTCHWTNMTIPFSSQGTGTIIASPIPAVYPSAAFSTADLYGDAIWSGTGSKPQIAPGHDFDYLCNQSRHVPKFYPVATIASNTTIGNFLANELHYGIQWFQSSTGGGDQRIGLINNAGACSIYRPQDALYYWQVVQGAHAWHNQIYQFMYDESGGDRMVPNNGTSNSGTQYPGLASNMGGWVSNNKCGSVDSGVVSRSATHWSGWSSAIQDQSGLGGQYYADPSHVPRPWYIAHLKTGRTMFLEQGINQAHCYHMMVYNGYQTQNGNTRYALSNGMNQSTQLRGWAWAWETLFGAMRIIPDNHLYYPVLRDIYNDNLGYEADRINTKYPTQQVQVGIPEVLDHGGFDSKGHYAPWMLSFFIQVVATEKWGGGQTTAGRTAISTISNFLANYWNIIQTTVDENAVNTISAYDLLYSTLNYSYGANVITSPGSMWTQSVSNGLIDSYPRPILYDHDAPGFNFPTSGNSGENYANFAQYAATMHALAEPSNTIVENARALISAAIANRTGQSLATGGLGASAWSGTSTGVNYNRLSYAVFKGS